MKIGFNRNGLTLNSKKFNPLNISVNGHGIESDESISQIHQIDPFELLASLASIKNMDETKIDQIKALKSAVNK